MSSKERIGYFPGNPKGAVPKSIIRRIMMLACICIFTASAFLLIRYFAGIASSKRVSRQMSEVYAAQETASETPLPSPTITPAVKVQSALPQSSAAPGAADLWPSVYPGNPGMRVSSVFYELQRQNPDIVGWLKIEGVLEEPVLQRDNAYYLTHNALGKRSVTGALFLDESCDLRTVPSQMVVHGHNMKEGAMFGALKRYKVKDASFYRAHPFIDFNTMYENGRYVIFAVAEVDIRPGRADHLPFWYHSRFSNVSEFESYVQKARTLSQYRCYVDVVPGDRLLTLATCSGTDDNKRLLVMARRVREGENELELEMAVLSTSDR